MVATTNQKHARMTHTVTVAGCAPILCRNAWVAEVIRKVLVRKHGTLNVKIEEKR